MRNIFKIFLAPVLIALLLLGCTSQDSARVDDVNLEQGLDENIDDWAKEMLWRVQVLSADSLQGRESGTPGGSAARRFLISEFERLGLAKVKSKRTQAFSFSDDSKTGENIVGEIRSQTLSDSSQTILIGAHYDHVGTKNGKVFNGADDNASGTSLMLAIADTLKDILLNDTRFVFVAFDAEEKGLIGSKEFVSANRDLLAEIDLMINFDMLSISDKRELYISGLHHNPSLSPIAELIEQTATYDLIKGHDGSVPTQQDWTFSSDHGPFHRAGIPHLYFGVEDHKHYHQDTDTYEVIDKQFYIDVAKSFRKAFAQLETKF